MRWSASSGAISGIPTPGDCPKSRLQGQCVRSVGETRLGQCGWLRDLLRPRTCRLRPIAFQRRRSRRDEKLAGGARPTAGECWLTLDRFLERAQLVLDSELARRDDLATMSSTMKLIASLDSRSGTTTWQLERTVPPDFYIESAAGRVRALFNNDDPVFHEKVTNALLGLLADSTPAGVKQAVRTLKKAWHQDENNYRWSLGIASAGDPPGQMRTDRQIARDWLYGDFVHADAEAQRRLRNVPREERLFAAASWLADVIRLTRATKQMYVDLRDAGCLTPRP